MGLSLENIARKPENLCLLVQVVPGIITYEEKQYSMKLI